MIRTLCAAVLLVSALAEPAMSAADDCRNSDELATVHIYRDARYVGSALRPTVMLGEEDLVNVPNGSHYVGRFPPGKYVFQMDDKKSGAEVDLKAGDVRYIKVEIIVGAFKGGGRMALVAPEQGAFESKSIEAIPSSEILDKTRVSNEDSAVNTIYVMKEMASAALKNQMRQYWDTEKNFRRSIWRSGIKKGQDGWGREMRYVVRPDRKSFLLVSSGADGEFNESLWAGDAASPVASESLCDDAVLEVRLKDGSFLRHWK